MELRSIPKFVHPEGVIYTLKCVNQEVIDTWFLIILDPFIDHHYDINIRGICNKIYL